MASFICPACRGQLYCIDTRTTKNEFEKLKNIRRDAQHVIRVYVCIECSRRYKGIEVLNPQHYAIRDIPKSYLRMKGVENG
uniref:Uncharacterized protein n=1 Tax=viral metagenome TaxID=1070528 RepID=A0A6M3IK99_9ZZZZ